MDTPTTPAGLRQFDDRAPVDAVIAAWTQPGPRPDHHARAQAEVRRTMPVLARALDRLTQTPRQ